MDKGIKMNSANAKNKIIELMKNYYNSKKELIDFLKTCSSDNTLKKEYENLQKELKNKELDVSKYQYCRRVGSNHQYGYCINIDTGEWILILNEGYKIGDFLDKCKTKDGKYEKIELKEGRIDSNYKSKVGIKLATDTDVYLFIKKAGLLDNDKSYEVATKIKLDNKDDTIGVHHINNNPNDNRIVNLIWLPKHIHDNAH